MPDTLHLELPLPMMAYKPFWSALTPEAGSGEAAPPSIEEKAVWLADFLLNWSRRVEDFAAKANPDDAREDPDASPNDPGRDLQWLFDSLGHAADTLLSFKRRDHPLNVPDSVLKNAHLVFSRAEERGLRAGGRTVCEIARRLAAATSHQHPGPRPVTIDEQGRIFDLSGSRLFQFDPEKVRRGREDIKAGRSHLLDDLREAERRNGR